MNNAGSYSRKAGITSFSSPSTSKGAHSNEIHLPIECSDCSVCSFCQAIALLAVFSVCSFCQAITLLAVVFTPTECSDCSFCSFCQAITLLAVVFTPMSNNYKLIIIYIYVRCLRFFECDVAGICGNPKYFAISILRKEKE